MSSCIIHYFFNWNKISSIQNATYYICYHSLPFIHQAPPPPRLTLAWSLQATNHQLTGRHTHLEIWILKTSELPVNITSKRNISKRFGALSNLRQQTVFWEQKSQHNFLNFKTSQTSELHDPPKLFPKGWKAALSRCSVAISVPVHQPPQPLNYIQQKKLILDVLQLPTIEGFYIRPSSLAPFQAPSSHGRYSSRWAFFGRFQIVGLYILVLACTKNCEAIRIKSGRIWVCSVKLGSIVFVLNLAKCVRIWKVWLQDSKSKAQRLSSALFLEFTSTENLFEALSKPCGTLHTRQHAENRGTQPLEFQATTSDRESKSDLFCSLKIMSPNSANGHEP